MLVKLDTSLLWNGRAYHHGDEVELPDDIAVRYIASRQAERVAPPVETAALRTQPAKGKFDERIKATRPSA